MPPTIDRRAKDVDTKRARVGQHEKVKGMAEQLEAAFQDPEILEAINRR
ncbi:MAG: hypothetical protein MZV49_24205 [Rhodopseudomonas palustris]|nr:hypothetical protein [Rhodopseudomonas palustris]